MPAGYTYPLDPTASVLLPKSRRRYFLVELKPLAGTSHIRWDKGKTQTKKVIRLLPTAQTGIDARKLERAKQKDAQFCAEKEFNRGLGHGMPCPYVPGPSTLLPSTSLRERRGVLPAPGGRSMSRCLSVNLRLLATHLTHFLTHLKPYSFCQD